MNRRWRTYDHPSDLGLSARADSLGELFQAFGEGLAEHICPRRRVRRRQTRRLIARADSREALLVEFLGGLHKLFVLEKFLIAGVKVVRIDDAAVEAEVSGEPFDADRHDELGPEIKAVTYHQLLIRRDGRRWTGRVLLDL